jgi:hypothetical protein
MTLKHARMENLIPPLSVNPIIEDIVQIELESLRGMLLRYLSIQSRGRPRSRPVCEENWRPIRIGRWNYSTEISSRSTREAKTWHNSYIPILPETWDIIR